VTKYRIKLIGVGAGFLHPVLTTENGRPLVLPNLWADDLMRYRRLNTARSYLIDLLVVYQWAQSTAIDIHHRISSLTGFRRMEIQRLIKALFMTSKGMPASSQTGYRRVQAIRSFFGFAFDVYCDLLVDPQARRDGEKVKERVLAYIAKYGDIHRSCPTGGRPATSLSVAEIETVSGALHPASPANPFADHAVRLRNFCIFLVAKEIWLRRSELVLLEVSDLNLGANPTIRIKWPSQKNLQKRRDGAGFKTNAREVPISDALAQALAFYLRTARDSFLKPLTVSTALFPSKKDGRRLSSGTVNTILAAVQRIPEVAALGKRIHPHGLRASGADEFHRHGTASNTANLRDCMEYVGGWAPGSPMPAHYAKKSVAEQVNKMVRKKK